MTHKYRFGFVLTTAAGNLTRYLNLRKYAERDGDVECVWAPIRHHLAPDPFRRLPDPLRKRAIVLSEAAPVRSRLADLDAVMYHAFEPFVLALQGRRLSESPLVIWSQDNPPARGQSPSEPQYGGNLARPPWRRRLRFHFDRWCSRRVDLFIPFSRWAGDTLVESCGVAPERVAPIHVGLDLELWPFRPKSEEAASGRPQVLFVGGDFERKGGDLLLSVWRGRFQGHADLHLVTKGPLLRDLPAAGVTVHTDVGANDPRLRQLYASSDLFVLPTRADYSSWVALEAMATGRPVVSTRMGGIPDIVRDGETGFLVAPGDGAGLADRMEALLSDASLRLRMGAAGRRVVEEEFSAAVCVPRILDTMKRAVDAVRARAAGECGSSDSGGVRRAPMAPRRAD